MKVAAIINTIKTYNGFIKQIAILRKQQIDYAGFGDEDGIKEMQTMIDDEYSKLGQFLNTEV